MKSADFTFGPRQPGLDRVVLALELGAHQAVALLDAAGHGVHADADGADAELLAGLPDRCPTARSPCSVLV